MDRILDHTSDNQLIINVIYKQKEVRQFQVPAS